VIHRTWTSKEPTVTWTLTLDSPVDSVNLDPQGKIALETHRSNNAKFRNATPKPITLFERLTFLWDVVLAGVLP
jgi:hypothetical protein